MEIRFDISRKHRVTDANSPSYAVPMLHPNRTMAEHDLIYMVQGTWEIGQGDEIFHLTQGDVLILNAGVPHYGLSHCAAGTKTMYIHALPQEGDSCRALPYSPEEDTLPLCSHIHTYGDPGVKSCFEKVIYAMACGNAWLASAYFDALLCELRECVQAHEKKHLAEQIRERITPVGHIPKNTDIARALNISVKAAEVAFKNTYGKTIHRCILETRVEQAKFYIVNHPDMTLSALAVTLGFYDEFHLSRHFKAICGISPAAFRKQVHGNK